ncbi:MAG TPA: ATP-binding protein [Methylomusa anaerophila]|uniref:histidine kinase n=1 Tax=Methylomusa anaerophila TaxID=1930071 RepID=A0A348AJG6_9FIRM|nr:ATP-binding protein [Methylomusa anaerophila]BBB91214.1 sporulation kinase E [Methylomusa anaerophila]HML89791.1 ATP-binding protein [Methylomusa anaerophila]
MRKFNRTTKLNIKVIGILAVFMFIFIVYSQWIAFQEKKTEFARQLATITEFLVNEMPASSFAEITVRRGAGGKPIEEQVMAVNREIQPILAKVLIPVSNVKYGIYSTHHQRLVAVGPKLEHMLLVTVDQRLAAELTNVNTPRLGQVDNSLVWYGAPILYHIRPISNNAQIIGYAVACVNLNIIQGELWQIAMINLLAGFLGLIIVIMLFQDMFFKLKQDLNLFAQAILKGGTKNFVSTISELTPVLQYISDQTEKMARLDRLNIIGEMAASIGHEVRNPLTTVRGFLQHMGNKKALDSYKEQFELMISELDRANSIITDFLSLAKNKAMDFKDLDLNKIIAEVTPMLQADALQHNCQLELDLSVVSTVCVDENSMRQLILNLVRNGIEAMPQGGTVKIATVNCGDKLMLAITDQGIGIPPEFMDKLGTPFFTTKDNGVGLGLAVCYRIVQRHGATISAVSQPGKGTNFTIEFNCNEKPA